MTRLDLVLLYLCVWIAVIDGLIVLAGIQNRKEKK